MRRLARIERELGPGYLLILWMLLMLAFIDVCQWFGLIPH